MLRQERVRLLAALHPGRAELGVVGHRRPRVLRGRRRRAAPARLAAGGVLRRAEAGVGRARRRRELRERRLFYLVYRGLGRRRVEHRPRRLGLALGEGICGHRRIQRLA